MRADQRGRCFPQRGKHLSCWRDPRSFSAYPSRWLTLTLSFSRSVGGRAANFFDKPRVTHWRSCSHGAWEQLCHWWHVSNSDLPPANDDGTVVEHRTDTERTELILGRHLDTRPHNHARHRSPQRLLGDHSVGKHAPGVESGCSHPDMVLRPPCEHG